MSRIPVGKTISDAYGYAFGQFPANLGITWLPLFLILAAMAFIFPLYFAAFSHVFENLKPMQPGMMPDMTGLVQAYRYMLLFYILEIFLLAQIMLGMTRRALGLQQGPVFAFFSVGTPVWRLFGAYLVMVVIEIAVMIVAEIAAAILALLGALIFGIALSGTSVTGSSAGTDVAVVLGIFVLVTLLLGAIVYVMARLTFLLTPAIVAENRFAVMRSWELTKGNFWRVFAIGLAIFVPVAIVILTFEVVMFSTVASTFIHAMPKGPNNDPQAAMQALNAFGAALTDLLRRYWYVIAGFSLIVSAVTYGLMAGAAASAYRSQTEGMGSPATFS
jgi:hypothetical protein